MVATRIEISGLKYGRSLVIEKILKIYISRSKQINTMSFSTRKNFGN